MCVCVCECVFSSSAAAEKQILNGHKDIFLKKTLAIDTFAKKGDATEPRVLVSPSLPPFLPPSPFLISLGFLSFLLTTVYGSKQERMIKGSVMTLIFSYCSD